EEWRWFEEPTGAQDGFGFFKTGITHLHFTEDEHRKAAELLSTVGWSPGMPWVCLLVRDAAYLNHHMPQQDWNYHNYRDADIDHYQKAALFLAERGYFVFRMGKVVSKKFGLNHPRVIDYANSDLNSDFLDIYLAANCHFFISTSAGLDGIAQIFRRPIVFTDLAPMSSQLQPWYPARLFIPKKVKDAAGKMLSFRETEQLLGDSMRPQALLAQYTLSLECNTADEILEVVSEMEARLSGHWHDAPEDEALQRQFQQSFPKNLVSPAYRRFRQDLDIRLGTAFLRRYGSQLWNEGEENAC
ncbi:MAG: TIGR04372 family glycosyltransferase, partial [Gammaproteobacteria bacterium]|nr:TIGR04372 family glycosyltransferase [Gammaproteobacteria bacterium]